jgi:hypothetical protein
MRQEISYKKTRQKENKTFPEFNKNRVNVCVPDDFAKKGVTRQICETSRNITIRDILLRNETEQETFDKILTNSWVI